jgi:hypothetical protein
VCARNALVSRSGSSKQSGKFFFDLLQPLSSSFVECRFQLVGPAACPINTIGSPNLRDFAPKLSETLNGQLLHGETIVRLVQRRQCSETGHWVGGKPNPLGVAEKTVFQNPS